MTRRLLAVLLVSALVVPAAFAKPPKKKKPEPAPAVPEAPAPPAAPAPRLDPAVAGGFASLALACVDRPYPFKSDRVLDEASASREPRRDHPIFYGCFDWHSAVHGHWMLARLAKLYPKADWTPKVRAALAARLTADSGLGEALFVGADPQKLFERPYGWAWALRLIAELRTWPDPDAQDWARNLEPLERQLVVRLSEYLPKLSHPLRVGQHPNTAFALVHALDYARAVKNEELEKLIAARARAFFLQDRACPVDYEPSGEDFLSPCLEEADLMRRVLSRDDFARWLDGFLPGLRTGVLGGLARPGEVSDPTDGKIVHLDGLNLSRAAALRGIAAALPIEDPRTKTIEELAAKHAAAGLARVASGNYEGEHWLASFAVYLETDVGTP